MKQSTIKKYLDVIKKAKKKGVSLKEYCQDSKDISYKSLKRAIRKLQQDTSKESRELVSMFTEWEAPEDKVEYIRDGDNKIKYYSYQIFRKGKSPLCGKLTREEMNTIHRLYSYYGDSLQQRIVSRYFVDLSLVDFKRILRAFNITKASAPFAPHMFEECNENELRDIQLREKENSFLRKAEEDQIRNNEKLLRKYAQENIELRNQLNNRDATVKELINQSVSLTEASKPITVTDKSDIIVFLSDLHIGAYNEKFGYVTLPDYNEQEITRRLNKIITYLLLDKYNSITICNLGDSVDSFNKQTTRGGHDLPTTISNKEQSMLFMNIMMNFFNKLMPISNNVRYMCVGEANHDGDWGWINNMVLSAKLKERFGIDSYISPNPIDAFNVNGVSIIYLHGKDNLNQHKGFPLTLDFKTESWFNAYFIDSDKTFKKKKCVVKGDLHQYAYTKAKHFDYISAPSLYGSSSWITANFGKTPWGVLALEVNKNNNIKTVLIDETTQMKIYVVVMYGDDWYKIEGAFTDKHPAMVLRRKLEKDNRLDTCTMSQEDWENILLNVIGDDEFNDDTINKIVKMFPDYSKDDVKDAVNRYDSGIIGINIEEVELHEANT